MPDTVAAMSRRYWIETDDTVVPQIEDIDTANTLVVRVFQRAPPFALGEVVAFFVGPEAEENAERFVKTRSDTLPPAADTALPGLVQALRARVEALVNMGYPEHLARAAGVQEAIDRIKPYEQERLALRTEVGALKMVLDSTRIGREAAEAEARALHRERKGEVRYWQGDGEDHLESLTCPVLIEADDLRRIDAELVALRAENTELRARLAAMETQYPMKAG